MRVEVSDAGDYESRAPPKYEYRCEDCGDLGPATEAAYDEQRAEDEANAEITDDWGNPVD